MLLPSIETPQEKPLPPDILSACQLFISRQWGLHFPPDRWSDLQRHLLLVTRELGYNDVLTCAQTLLHTPIHQRLMQRLIKELTVGETYFLRDTALFEHLARTVLAPLITQRRAQGLLTLRLWSAGCCTGEEAYSLAIILGELLPDIAHWNIDIIGTDINTHFLAKAHHGIYGKWSFRQVSPAWQLRYFHPESDSHWRINDNARRLVRFFELNLVEPSYPDLTRGLAQCDVILCRNVLMYFSPAQAVTTLQKLRETLTPEGVLILASVESMPCQWVGLSAELWPGGLCLRHAQSPQQSPQQPAIIPPPLFSPQSPPLPPPPRHGAAPQKTLERLPPACPHDAPEKSARSTISQWELAQSNFHAGRYDHALLHVDTLLKQTGVTLKQQADAAALCARIHANQGHGIEALDWINQAIQMERLEPHYYWILASVLMESGRTLQARDALAKALYLAPDFLLAHYLSGLLSLKLAQPERAFRHLQNCLAFLQSLAPKDPVPEGDGLCVAELVKLAQMALKKHSHTERVITTQK